MSLCVCVSVCIIIMSNEEEVTNLAWGGAWRVGKRKGAGNRTHNTILKSILNFICWFLCVCKSAFVGMSTYTYVYIPHAYKVPTEDRKGCQIPWNWRGSHCEPPGES